MIQARAASPTAPLAGLEHLRIVGAGGLLIKVSNECLRAPEMVDARILIGKADTAHLGNVWVAVSRIGLVAVEYGVSGEQFQSLVQRLTHVKGQIDRRSLLSLIYQIEQYVRGRRRDFDLSIDWSILHSEFQRTVLRAVLRIPYGQTRTYGQVAAEIGFPQAARAVGRANATNPMPLVIPCHRVIGGDGKLHGYGGVGGLRTKAWLLRMEALHA